MNGTVVYIDNKEIPIENEQNLLELVRKARIDLPTFCYHSELSIYGACRLCMVQVEGLSEGGYDDRLCSPVCEVDGADGLHLRADAHAVTA